MPSTPRIATTDAASSGVPPCRFRCPAELPSVIPRTCIAMIVSSTETSREPHAGFRIPLRKKGWLVEPIHDCGIVTMCGRHPPFITAPVADSQRSSTRCSEHAHARIAKGGGHLAFCEIAAPHMSSETPESPLQPSLVQPSLGERAIDAATDVSRTITEVSEGLRAAADRLSDAIATSRRPGGALATLSAVTREAPLASLFVAFLLGVAAARRR